jgi:predicted TIM-barrel fold metal-dependent hydrolase
VRDLSACGAQIFTNVAGHPLDEPRFEPVLAALAELDVPIWLHPARTAGMPDSPPGRSRVSRCGGVSEGPTTPRWR